MWKSKYSFYYNNEYSIDINVKSNNEYIKLLPINCSYESFGFIVF